MLRPDSGTCLSLSVNQSKKRLSVSPIISTYSFYNKLNLNSPLVGSNQNTTITTTTTSTTTTTTTTTLQVNSASTTSQTTTSSNLISAHQHYFQRNFSPMATLSRSPSCSSSPAVINSVRRSALNTQSTNQISNSTLINHRNSLTSNQIQSTLLHVNNATNFMTPLLEVNSHPYNSNQYRTPLNLNQQQTPMNFKRTFTPQLNSSSLNALGSNEIAFNEPVFENAQPEYCFELVWTEANNFTGELTYNEKATKFFCTNDLYNQKYVCFLVPNKNQLRCLKIDYNYDTDLANPSGTVTNIPAKDAVYVENRNLMVVIDLQGNLFVYSGTSKLCKLQLHNIVWSNSQFSLNQLKKILRNFFKVLS